MQVYNSQSEYMDAMQQEIDRTDWASGYSPIQPLLDSPLLSIERIYHAYGQIAWGSVDEMTAQEQAEILVSVPIVLAKIAKGEPLANSSTEWAVFHTVKALVKRQTMEH